MSSTPEPSPPAAAEDRDPRQRPRSALLARLVRLPLHPFELYTLAVFGVSYGVLRFAWGLRLDWITFEWTFGPFMRYIPRLLLMGVVLQLLYRAAFALVKRDPGILQDYFKSIVRPGWILLWLRLCLAYMLINYVYFWVKVSIPLVNYRLWDSSLWLLDRLFHLGLSPSIFLVELFQGTFLVPLLDWWYGVYIVTVMGTITFFCCASEDRLRRSFMLSCCILWTIGPWIYMSVPAMGPVYHHQDVFRPVLSDMPSAVAGQDALWQNYQRMLEGRTGPLRSFNPTRGIGAMPSLHVAAHFLFALWARRHARPLLAPFVVATLLTYLGSIVSGWHYALDGYVGILLAYGAYRLALWWDPPEAAQAAESTAGP